MSFLSRLFKKKKEPDAPEPPRSAPAPAKQEPVKAAPPPPPPPPPPPVAKQEPVKPAPPPPPVAKQEPPRPAPQPPSQQTQAFGGVKAPEPPKPTPQPPSQQTQAFGGVKAPEPPRPAPQPPSQQTQAFGGVKTPEPPRVEPVKPPEPQRPAAAGTMILGAPTTGPETKDQPDEGLLPEVEAARSQLETPVMGGQAVEPRAASAGAQSATTPAGPLAAKPGGGLNLEGDFFDDLLDDFDSTFDAALGTGADAPAAKPGEEQQLGVIYAESPVRELFADIAANYVRSVRNFMLELNRGETAKEWIDICQPAVHSIKRAASNMDLRDVFAAIEDFDAMLEMALSSPGRMIAGEAREGLLDTYAELVELMPQAFTLDAERDQRESIIIHSLLLQVPDVRKVTVDKLYAAGLTTLDVFFLAKPEDLAATAGIPDWLASKIVDKFQGYRSETQSTLPDVAHSAERAKLARLIESLRDQQEGYERASTGWSEDAIEEKKRLRQARQDTLLQINVVLAQVGEVDIIHELEKLPFERRIERLEAHLTNVGGDDVPL